MEVSVLLFFLQGKEDFAILCLFSGLRLYFTFRYPYLETRKPSKKKSASVLPEQNEVITCYPLPPPATSPKWMFSYTASKTKVT